MAMAESDLGPLFEFNVSEPEKKEKATRTGQLSYWTYHVLTKTTLQTFSQKEVICVRRYNDFVWLREKLVEQYPGCIVPPIPEKSLKGALEKVVMMNANPLLEYRQRALRKFLVRVGAHPILCTSDLFRTFLTISEDEMQKKKEEPKKKEQGSVGDKIKSMSFSVFGSKKNKGGSEPSSPTEPSEEGAAGGAEDGKDGEESQSWRETKIYADTLEKCLVQLKDRIELLVRRRRETSGSLSEFGKSFVKVGEIENHYEPGSLPKALVDVGHHAEHLSIVYQEQADNETIQVVETINYYIGLAAAVREVIKQVSRIERIRDIAQHSLQQLVDKRAKLVAGGQEEQQRKLEVEIANARQKATDCGDHASSVVNTFREELRRFHREKQYDIKQMLSAFVELQLEYSSKMKNSWESVLPSVEAIKTTS